MVNGRQVESGLSLAVLASGTHVPWDMGHGDMGHGDMETWRHGDMAWVMCDGPRLGRADTH